MTCRQEMRKCETPDCNVTFVAGNGRRRYCTTKCRLSNRERRVHEGRAGERTCACPDCQKPFVWNGKGRVPNYCSRKCGMRGARHYGLRFNALPVESGTLGPEEPQVGMTPAQAQSRKERIVLQLLAERVPTSAIEERFAESGVDVKGIAARYRVPMPRGGTNVLPYGAPAW